MKKKATPPAKIGRRSILKGSAALAGLLYAESEPADELAQEIARALRAARVFAKHLGARGA